MSTAGFILAPEIEVTKKKIPLDDKLEALIHYRGGYKKIKKLPEGAKYAFLSNAGAIDEFNFGEFSGDELESLVKLCKGFGGEHLGIWTYGNSLHMMYVSSKKPGNKPLIRECSLRLSPYNSDRDKNVYKDVKSWFSHSSFKPDFNALEEEYNSGSISLKNWFKAFGLSGARELESKDTEKLWKQFENIVNKLLTGESVPGKELRELNSEIRRQDEESVIKAKPYKKTGRTAYELTSSIYCLTETLGEPKSGLWKERFRAANFYWDISDCKGSCERLTVGDEKHSGLGVSASFGRLLLHYPIELRRDNIFWVLATAQIEGANGHAYTESSAAFAENSHQASSTLVIVPTDKLESFRKDFGIHEFEKSEPISKEWSSEYFVELPGILKVNPKEKVKNWLEKNKTSGAYFTGNQDGSYEIKHYQNGKEVDSGEVVFNTFTSFDGEKLKLSAKNLEPLNVFNVLGLENLVEPGEWSEGAYGGEGWSEKETVKEKEEAREKLSNAPTPTEVRDHRFIFLDRTPFKWPIPSRFEIKNRLCNFKITFPNVDEELLLSLKRDLLGGGLIAGYGTAWSEGNNLWGYTRTNINIHQFLRVLGDLPDKAYVLFDSNKGKLAHYVINKSKTNSEKWEEKLLKIWQGEEGIVEDSAEEEVDEEIEIKKALEIILSDFDLNNPEERDMAFGFAISEGIEGEHIVNQLLLKGKQYNYYDLDISGFEYLKEDLFKNIDQEVTQFGYKKLGDLYTEMMMQSVLRGYADEDGTAYFMAVVMSCMSPMYEVYTLFEDNTSITTTTNQYLMDLSSMGVEYNKFPENTKPADLLEAHKKQVEELKQQGKQPVKNDPSLLGFANAIEGFLLRTVPSHME